MSCGLKQVTWLHAEPVWEGTIQGHRAGGVIFGDISITVHHIQLYMVYKRHFKYKYGDRLKVKECKKIHCASTNHKKL